MSRVSAKVRLSFEWGFGDTIAVSNSEQGAVRLFGKVGNQLAYRGGSLEVQAKHLQSELDIESTYGVLTVTTCTFRRDFRNLAGPRGWLQPNSV